MAIDLNGILKNVEDRTKTLAQKQLNNMPSRPLAM
jgi:hypothetical protein